MYTRWPRVRQILSDAQNSTAFALLISPAGLNSRPPLTQKPPLRNLQLLSFKLARRDLSFYSVIYWLDYNILFSFDINKHQSYINMGKMHSLQYKEMLLILSEHNLGHF